ncbi:7TM GPCR serpentine receptor class x (Srx) domain-containing protein [Caenorhabditis elegans]|uniref:7TM GPCR serpentine receptor class x (Srx) domain-containing protein n=1 Tax=Caenorhabditis elegans TaxID=6239 RepID=Q9GYL0_CAEEL|nr:7TM GPCR serpentine receptor class x (Srx) domain-containing protein [Caenorhabditis elegans]CCD73334.2 7TM GPCR serpentine receptor class x (Srx) domain-containing protein [Caenorhabditis elegans]|eukprot:NP_501057.3 Serpentine Receptor, class X [Caenorhabditis elegans]
MMSDQMIDAMITVVIMTFGLITNIIVLLTARKMSSMRSSFGIITKNQAVCNILMCLLFLIFVGPLHFTSLKLPYKASRFVGTVSMIIYEIAAQLNFFNSLNRFCAVYMIFLYDRIFSNFNTYMLRNFAVVVSIGMCFTFYEFLGCYLYFEQESWLFSYPENDVRCDQLTWYCDFIFNMSLVVATLFLNLLAAYKARKLHRIVSDSTGVGMSKDQRQREFNFIRQSFFQGLSMSVALIFYRITAPMLENQILLFLDANLWAFMLAFEGGIILLSNQEMMQAVKKKRHELISSVFVLDI